MLSEAARTALATNSDAKPGIYAPPLGAIADRVLIVLVQRVGDANVTLQLVGQSIGDARADQPIRVEPNQLRRKDVEICVGPIAGIGHRGAIGQAPTGAVDGD